MKQFSIYVTEDLVKAYSDVSGDDNPIHLSRQVAKTAGFSDKVAHGMLSMALCSSVLSPLIGENWFVSNYRANFIAPVLVDELLQINVAEIKCDVKQKKLHIIGRNEQEEQVFNGKMTLTNMVT